VAEDIVLNTLLSSIKTEIKHTVTVTLFKELLRVDACGQWDEGSDVRGTREVM
jgi:hypothetical protein